MPEMESKTSVTLPEELRRQFVAVSERLWRVETTVAVSGALGALGASALVVFVSDRLWDTPGWVRTLLLGAGLGGAAAAGALWAGRWVWRRRDARALARLVQKKHRRLGDRLLGIVELANEQRHDANFSPALYQAAIRQVAEEASQYDFKASVSPAPARRAGAAAGAVALILAGAVVLLPAALGNAMARWAAPWAPIPRYTLVKLEGFPPELIVPHGEPFVMTGRVQYRSFWHPRGVVGWLAGQPQLAGKVNGEEVRLAVTGQVEKGRLRVRVGDSEADVLLDPVHRPALQNLEAEVQYPAYLQRSNDVESIQDGALSTVEGSKVSFHGSVTRDLASATMALEGATNSLPVSGTNFSAPATEPAGMAQFTFNWEDKLGLSNAAPLEIADMVEKDAPPSVTLPDMPGDVAMLASDALRIEVAANDDYGVRDLGLTWDVESATPLGGTETTEVKTMAAQPDEKKITHAFRWSPAMLRLPAGSVVTLQGFARDYYPQRARSRTAAHRIRVLSPEEHAELVRQQLEAAMAQLEDVTRLQEKITVNAEDTQAATNMPAGQKSSRMGEAKDDQLQNAAQLQQLSQQGEQAVEEAMKNPIFKESTIQQWNAAMQQWQKLAQQQMQDAAKSMGAAQQSSKEQAQQIAEAAKKSEDILQKLEEMQAKANQHMDDLQALTLAERLRKVGSQEKDIGGQLLGTASDTIGLPPEDLPAKYKRLDGDLTKDQGQSLDETAKLENEIGRFFERTRKPNYGDVNREMKETHVTDELDHLSTLIQNNIAMDASASLSQWSDRFAKWGDALEPKENSSSGQGSSSNSQQQNKNDLTKQLIALLRLREQQLNLRDDAQTLEQNKGDAKAYKEQAGQLSARQKKIGAGLEQVHKDTDVPQLDSAFADAGQAAQQARGFLDKPETDKPSDDAQALTINAMTDLINLINEQAQRPKPSQSQAQSQSEAEQMQFLLQAMKKSSQSQPMALKPATGLNHNGGTTDRAGNPLAGSAGGKSGPTRSVQKASGVAPNAPAEFREALDNYYHGMEQNK